MARADSIAAKFGGRAVTFKIDRQDLPAFECMLAIPAAVMIARLLSGQWTVEALGLTLKFAALGPKALQMVRVGRYRGRHHMETDIVGSIVGARGPRWVDEVLSKQPPADYVALAAGIITAALMGVEAADATFDDGIPASG